jgi:hypothetical protein
LDEVTNLKGAEMTLRVVSRLDCIPWGVAR